MSHLGWSIPHTAELVKILTETAEVHHDRGSRESGAQSSPYGTWPCQPHDRMQWMPHNLLVANCRVCGSGKVTESGHDSSTHTKALMVTAFGFE